MQDTSGIRTSSTLPLTDDRWEAVAARDARFDARFVYAVRTTGIYCRPACGARTPNRENVLLFTTPEAAEREGFRACRRCRPREAMSPADATVAQIREMIDERLEADPEAPLLLRDLAAEADWSPAHLHRTFSTAVGLSPKGYADARRIELSKAALRQGETVLAATFEGGFSSGKALYDRAEEAFGMTPGTYRRGGAGLSVCYALFDTALGAALVAGTDEGICAVSLGDDADKLVADLHQEFHAADVGRDDVRVGPWAEPILRVLAGAPDGSLPEAARRLLRLPVDVRGTAFQRRVWSELRRIPFGETVSYSELAERIGRPTAARAVAGACGSNRVALLVPCHRVVGADGALRGYRWGTDRKRRLLEMEA